MHDFCSKRHAKEAMAHPGGGMGASKCTLKGCSKNVYRDSITGLESDYCSRGHQAHAIALGQGMGTVTSHVEQVFRGGTTGATDFKRVSFRNPILSTRRCAINSSASGSRVACLMCGGYWR
ncbi:unnamed protein product [Ectocarpus sp. 12 AP-2014]